MIMTPIFHFSFYWISSQVSLIFASVVSPAPGNRRTHLNKPLLNLILQTVHSSSTHQMKFFFNLFIHCIDFATIKYSPLNFVDFVFVDKYICYHFLRFIVFKQTKSEGWVCFLKIKCMSKTKKNTSMGKRSFIILQLILFCEKS